jgi:hypothetical protein
MTFKGILAGETRNQLRVMSKDEVHVWFGRQLLYRFPDASCDSVRVDGLENPDLPLRLSVRFSGADLLISGSGRFSFQPGGLALYDWNYIFPESERRHPVAVQYPIAVVDSVALRFPASWKLESAVRSDSASCTFGKYSWKTNASGADGFVYVRWFQVFSTRVDTSNYPEFRAFLNRAAQGDRAVVTWRRE